MKQLIAFDLDGTLAESKQPLDEDMGRLLAGLMTVAKVAIISGGDWPQFQKQVVSRLPDGANVTNFYILPTTGTKLYRNEGEGWRPVYAEVFGDEEKLRILATLDHALVDEKMVEAQIWGERIEDRGSQITFSGLGQEAPLAAKEAWDPDRRKRERLQAILQAKLPDISINIGGSTSLDITRPGIDKAYGLKKLAEHSGVPLEAMLFLGDAIFPGGNDYPALTLGLDTVRVRDVQETKSVVSAITVCLSR